MTDRAPKPVELADRRAEELATADATASRAWWRRVPQALRDPVAVFGALRETDEVDRDARSEPLTAIVILAGMGGILLTPAWGSLMDDSSVDGLVVAVLTFVGGVFYGSFGYFLLGLAVWVGAKGAGVDASFRLSRQLVGFSVIPLALSIVATVPIVLLGFGGDWFASGGADEGVARAVVVAIGLVFAAWSLALVVVGLRVTFRLPWRGVATALLLAAVIVAALVVLPSAV